MVEISNSSSPDKFTLQDLAEIIRNRSQSDDEGSYTRTLISGGLALCSKKFGEEAMEVVIAALRGNKDEIVNETADLLYHLLVLLEQSNVELAEVLQELAKRTSQSGLEEKLARQKK